MADDLSNYNEEKCNRYLILSGYLYHVNKYLRFYFFKQYTILGLSWLINILIHSIYEQDRGGCDILPLFI